MSCPLFLGQLNLGRELPPLSPYSGMEKTWKRQENAEWKAQHILQGARTARVSRSALMRLPGQRSNPTGKIKAILRKDRVQGAPWPSLLTR